MLALRRQEAGTLRGPRHTGAIPAAQRQAIEQATGEPAQSFLARFRLAARDDICRPGGVLHTQWSKWQDLASKDLLKFLGGVLAGMGLSGNALALVAVALAVYLVHLGLEAFCREG